MAFDAGHCLPSFAPGPQRAAQPRRAAALARDRRDVGSVAHPRVRFEDILRQLRRAGVRLPADQEAGWCEYRHRRHGWELQLAAFALYLGYDWDKITGDDNLRLAAE